MPKVLATICSALLPIAAGAAFAAAAGQEADIRAGQNIAVTRCVACHVASANQGVKPVLGAGIPSFQEIADRPGTNAESLGAAMKNARWHEPAMAATLLPMSRLSGKERGHVAAYILSLRKKS